MNPFKLKYPEFKAEIYYLTEAEGGRKNYVVSGYRGQFYYDGRDWEAVQEFIDREKCFPGESIEVKMRTLSPDFHAGRLFEGKEFLIREGAKTVGQGIIREILRDDFYYWDYESFHRELPPDCLPLQGKELDEFITDMRYGLAVFEEIDEITFFYDPELRDQVLTVRCTVSDPATDGRTLLAKICEQWRDGALTLEFEMYKATLERNTGKGFTITIDLATWGESWLTGQIIVHTPKEYAFHMSSKLKRKKI